MMTTTKTLGGASIRAVPKSMVMKVTPAHIGALVEHFPGGVSPGINSPKRFVFPNSDALIRHIAKAARGLRMNNLKGVA